MMPLSLRRPLKTSASCVPEGFSQRRILMFADASRRVAGYGLRCVLALRTRALHDLGDNIVLGLAGEGARQPSGAGT
jgi:hypothetical protein